MADDNLQEPIIIKKKKGGGHGGHHGGSWKVAYADFVTSMMAFFLVMWLIAQSETVRMNVAGYFQNPTGFKKGGETSVMPKKGTSFIEMKDKNMMTQEQIRKMREQEARERLKEAAAEIMKKLKENPSFERLRNQIEVQMTAEGLRVQLIESAGESFFERGSAELKPFTKQLLAMVAAEIGRLPNRVIIEGHTDAFQYADGAAYTNWELSVDRCNSARRWMKENGLRFDQIAEVRGYADTQPKVKESPGDPRNRRIAIIVENEYSGLNFIDKNVVVDEKEVSEVGAATDTIEQSSIAPPAVDQASAGE